MDLLRFCSIALTQKLEKNQFPRTPEPVSLSNETSQVFAYDKVLDSALTILYAIGYEIVHRSFLCEGKTLVDLASGPGYFTLGLAEHCGFQSAIGVDLAEKMVALSNSNSAKKGFSPKCLFKKGDIQNLKNEIPDHSADVVSFTDAAHHFSDIDSVQKVLQEAERIVKPEGMIFVMDLVRLKNGQLTESYLKVTSSRYPKLGLMDFYPDYKHSMYAAWTPEELSQAVPVNSSRNWFQWVSPFLPSVQILIGLPKTRNQLWLRKSFPWKDKVPVAKDFYFEWLMLHSLLKFAKVKQLS